MPDASEALGGYCLDRVIREGPLEVAAAEQRPEQSERAGRLDIRGNCSKQKELQVQNP